MAATYWQGPPRRVFLDTNVFVYVFDASAPLKQARARDMLKQCLAQGNGVIGLQVSVVGSYAPPSERYT